MLDVTSAIRAACDEPRADDSKAKTRAPRVIGPAAKAAPKAKRRKGFLPKNLEPAMRA